MPQTAELMLESEASDRARKNPTRGGTRKFASGERGFQTGSYPRRGPFQIYRKREDFASVRRLPNGGNEAREGRTFYVLGEYPRITPPTEGWIWYLATEHGAGTYRVHHNQGTERAIMHVTAEDVERAARRNPPPFTPPPEVKTAHAPNPPAELIAPADPFESILDALDRADEIRERFASATPNPPEPSIMQQVLQNPAIMQAFMQALQTTPRPNPPPPPPPPPDPYALIGTYARRAGIDPRQAIEVLAQAAAERAAAAAANEDADEDAEREREA